MERHRQTLAKLSILRDSRVADVLAPLHAEASRHERKLALRFWKQLPRMALRQKLDWAALSPKLSDLYLAVDVDNGLLCYLLLRAMRARRVIEVGTSMGVSTIYLAAAVRDNGGGTVVATELVPEKAARARQNLSDAGLLELVDLRVGDAAETLAGEHDPIDFVMNDAFPPLALPIMQRLAPYMRPGAIALCGNAVLFPADHEDYVRWMRDPKNGFSSLKFPMKLAGEISVRAP